MHTDSAQTIQWVITSYMDIASLPWDIAHSPWDIAPMPWDIASLPWDIALLPWDIAMHILGYRYAYR